MNQLPILICIEFINSSINEWKSMCCNQQPPSHSKASWIRAHSNGIDWKYDCRFLFLAASAYFLIQKLTSQSLFMQLATTFWDLSLYPYLRRWVKIHFVIILLCGSKVVLRCFMVSKWLGRRCKMHSSHTWALSNSSPHQICMTVFCWENSTTTTTKKMEWFGAHSPDIHSENGWKNEVPFRKICKCKNEEKPMRFPCERDSPCFSIIWTHLWHFINKIYLVHMHFAWFRAPIAHSKNMVTFYMADAWTHGYQAINNHIPCLWIREKKKCSEEIFHRARVTLISFGRSLKSLYLNYP